MTCPRANLQRISAKSRRREGLRIYPFSDVYAPRARARAVKDFLKMRLGTSAPLGVRIRATVGRGSRSTSPCPKLHTDDVVLRCLCVLDGAGTLVASGDGRDAECVSPNQGDAVLLKGRRWPFWAQPAWHKSPAASDEIRVLLAVDRLADLERA